MLRARTGASGRPLPGDFLGRCLVGECEVAPELMLPDSTYFGLPKAASYLYGTWRDADGTLIRALRGVGSESSSFRYVFDTDRGGQLERNARADEELYAGPTSVRRDGDEVVFQAPEASRFRYRHTRSSCRWRDGELIDLAGYLIAPAIQWYNPWPGGGCFSATCKYRVTGSVLGRAVEGFVGHEIHYMPDGVSWMDSPYGRGREICWQQVANEYDDGTIEQATFAYGADGWGFALVHDAEGFHASTSVTARAAVRANGYPEWITYSFDDQRWTWRIDPHGERATTIPGAPLGADGTCTRDGEARRVILSMGNSDWWVDGRADHIIERAAVGEGSQPFLTAFDPTAPDFASQREVVYRTLRDEAPVLHDEVRNTWVLSRFDDVFRAASDPATFSSTAAEAEVLLPMLNYLDAPRHTELRRLVSRAFTPARTASMEASVRDLAEELLAAYVNAGGGDLISGFAAPLASTVVGRLIGIPADRLDRFRHLTDQLLLVGQQGGTDDLTAVATGIYSTFAEVLTERRSSRRDDLISGLLTVQDDGGLTDEELLGFCFLLVGGGNDTTSNLIANGWLLALDHPEQLTALERQRSLVPGAIEEMLRLRPPAESHARTTTAPVTLHGVSIPTGARVQLLWGAANLDEREFPSPEHFAIHRRPERHLAFGHGPHYCLGAALARLEARMAFDALLDRIPDATLDRRPQRLPSPWACALASLDLRVPARPSVAGTPPSAIA